MHRERNVIAVGVFEDGRAEVQVYELDPPGKTLTQFTVNEQVTFWRWIDNNRLALIGAKGIYHADIEDPNSEPEKIFDRHDRMVPC